MTSPTLYEVLLGGLLEDVTGHAAGRFVLPNRVWTFSTLTSALWSLFVTAGLEENLDHHGMKP
jgi:hypothetical protein